jgi:hypothetical protein
MVVYLNGARPLTVLHVTATIGSARMQMFCKQILCAVVAYTAETTCQLTVKHQPSALRRCKTLCRVLLACVTCSTYAASCTLWL